MYLPTSHPTLPFQSYSMTRSGKIMRRILRKIAADELDTLGDVSTLADPSVVDTLIVKVQKAQGKTPDCNKKPKV